MGLAFVVSMPGSFDPLKWTSVPQNDHIVGLGIPLIIELFVQLPMLKNDVKVLLRRLLVLFMLVFQQLPKYSRDRTLSHELTSRLSSFHIYRNTP